MRAHENPFRSSLIDGLEYLPGEHSLADIATRFDALGRIGAIIGPHGSGKTTLLETLRKKFAGENILFTDSAGLLGPLGFLRLLAKRKASGAGLLITAHRPLPFIPTLIECRPSLEISTRLVKSLSPSAVDREVAALFSAHNGNMHEIFRALYRAAL